MSSEMEALKRELASLKTANQELAQELSIVRLEKKELTKQMRHSAGSTETDDTDAAGLSQGVNDLRVMALRRKRDAMNLETTHNDGSSSRAATPVEEGEAVKTEATTLRITKALQKRTPFDTLEDAQLKRLVLAMTAREAVPGDVLVREGEQGNLCFLVEAGELTVSVGGADVDTIRTGAVFGELSLIYNVPRTATIVASTPVTVWVLHRTVFQRTLRAESISRRREIFATLKMAPMFKSMADRQLSRLADVSEIETFAPGAVIVKEGEIGQAMYILKAGQAVVSQEMPEEMLQEGEPKRSKLCGILQGGEYFGERALLTEEPRSATVAAVSPVECLRIDRTAFNEHVGTLHNQLKEQMPNDRPPPTGESAPPSRRGSVKPSEESTADAAAASSYTLVSAPAAAPPPGGRHAPRGYRPAFRTLKTVQPLGVGGFARVVMVRDRVTRRIYAMKIVNKQKLLAFNAQVRCEAVVRERQALDEMEHPFIVQLHATYQDADHIYFLLDVALGGELFRVMEQLDKLQEPMARFYVGSLTLALQHIHMLEYVYRDLKPENVLLDCHGYIKLCDFGFAKKLEDRTYTQCGTPDYVAPEMLMGQGVNQACDWWALGVLLYEMISGFPPFTDKDGQEMKTFANILKGQLEFRSGASYSANVRALISGLLQVKVTSRLGYSKGGAEDLISHAWFAHFDWDALVNLTLEPPWHPRLKTADDVSYFDVEGQQETFDEQEKGTEKGIAPEEYAKWQHVWDVFD